MSKIVIICNLAESLINFHYQLLIRWRKSGWDVLAIAPDFPPEVIVKLNYFQISTKTVTMEPTGLNPVKDLKTVIALSRILKSEQPDVVFSYTIKPVIYGTIAAKFAGIPNIYSMITGLGYVFIGSSIKVKLIKTMVQLLYKFTLKFNQKVFFLNPDDKNLFLNLGIIENLKSFTLNGTGVDLEHFAQVPLPKKLSFLLIARLLKDKGIGEYIESARLVKQQYPFVHFNLVGGLSLNPAAISISEIEKAVQEGLIIYWGKVDDVRPFISSSTIFVLPSYREGVPRSTLEALSMGRPVITTDSPGCRETVQNEVNGFLVPVKDAHSLALAMINCIEQPEILEKMAQSSRNLAEEKFNVHTVNKVLSEAIHII